MFARPGYVLCDQARAIFIALAIIALGSGTSLFASVQATSLASGLLLIVGLPHGALDIATIRRVAPRDQLAVVTCYLGAAAVMFAIWMASPLTGLVVFYVTAMAHFAHDWEEQDTLFFRNAIAVALLTAPALLHGPALQSLFVALTGDAQAVVLSELLKLIAPIAIATAAVGLATLTSTSRRIEGICALIASLVLPPVIGFAVFFCLFHSPRHFKEGWAALGPSVKRATSVRIVAMVVAGFGIAALIYTTAANLALPDRLFATSMMTLSVLTVPHMLLDAILKEIRLYKHARSDCDHMAPMIAGL